MRSFPQVPIGFQFRDWSQCDEISTVYMLDRFLCQDPSTSDFYDSSIPPGGSSDDGTTGCF